MKKLTVALALVLCLVLCVFAFASCEKKNKKGKTTAAPTADPAASIATTDAATTEEATLAPCVHVPGEFEILKEPTCTTDGEKVKYCELCGERLDDTIEAIPSDPEAHRVNDWVIVEPTLLDPVGSQTGTCLLCDENIEKILNWEINPYSSVERTGKYADNNDFRFHKSVADIRGDKHFCPTDEDPDGNDLWFEYSFLWNDTLQYRDTPANLSEIRMFGFRESTSWSTYRGFYYLYLLNDDDKGPADGAFHTSNDCPWKGHIDFSTYYPGSTPGENCALDLLGEGNTLNGKPIGRYIAGWGAGRDDSPYLWDSEYQTMGGWHRIGFHYHQEAEIVEGEVRYSGYTELFIDGVKCWKVLTNMEGYQKEGTWKDTDWSLKGKNLLLWTATIDEEDPTKLNYTDHDSMMIECRADSIGKSSQEVLVAVDDVQYTCGDGFATPVVRVENPEPVTIQIADGVEGDGAIYFAKPAN